MHKYDMVEYLYNLLPPAYRHIDKEETNETLRRYLGTLGDSVDNVLDDTVNLLELIDVEKIPTRLLPYYGRLFGFDYDTSVPEDFQRKFLANIVDIYKRKGTKAVIRYTARELTGMNATVTEGHYLGFKTWGTNPHDEKCGEYEQPRTYGGKDKSSFYFLGGENTSRYTITVTLGAVANQNSDDIFLNTQLISRYTRDLVQPYVNLRYKAYGITYSDEGCVSNITECDNLKVLDKYTRKASVVESEVYNRLYSTENLTYDNNLISKPLDKVKLLQDILDDNVNEVQEVGTDTMRIVTRTSDNMTIEIEDSVLELIIDIPTPDNLDTYVKVQEKFRIKDNDSGILNYKEDTSVDYIHSNIISDIIGLGDRIETSFNDKITEIE